MRDEYDRVELSYRADWRAWLAVNHERVPGVWAVTYKKGCGPYVAYEELVEEALAFGWIDSLRRALDADRSQLLMTPRRRGSKWSKPNKERIARLIAAGGMTPAGEAAVARAKEDGTWEALDAVEALQGPPDLGTALDADPAARRHWEAFPRSTKRAVLEWITSAKRPDTRERRIRETVERAAQTCAPGSVERV